ncbi:glutamate-rich protein 6 isoform X1 [Pleurodeles waltl]|uniref:glutamate-rich protein 6 isoform X1 n=1 Tax=Pleurodeles waltl TaxID=8319 RepID=UPI0037096793
MASGDRAARPPGGSTLLAGVPPAPGDGSADSGSSPCTGTKHFPRILGGIRREETSFSSSPEVNNERHVPQNTDATAKTKSKGISVSMQTEESWLYENSERKMDVFSTLVEDLGDLSVLCEMELNEDFLKIFEDSTHTLPKVGPPTILAYKPESSEKDRDYSKIQMLVECSLSALCEFCGKTLKPFPLNYLLSLENAEQFFCCREFQKLFESLFHEQNEVREKDGIALISIAPHPPHGSELERQRAKEKAAQRLRERQMAKYYASMTATTATDTASLSEYGKHQKTISYQLSNAPPSGGSWTVAPKMAAEQMDVDGLPDITCDFSVACEKLMPRQFLERYYKNGVKFLTIFPDATAQLFYPSGNLAIIVTHVGKDFLCIVQEEKSRDARIQALFGSSGKGTCYHPNGNVWINIDTTGGQYSDKDGNRVRTWRWESNFASESHSLFKPIFISLNHNIGVRIFGQDKIIISFLAMGKQARFSVGVKLEVKEPELVPALRRNVQEEELLLLANKIKILSLFSRLHGCLNFSSKKQCGKFKPPSYLVSQTQKLIHLCRLSSVGGDIGASIKAILEDQ